MSKTKVLIVTQEMKPYLFLDTASEIARKLPQHLQQSGMELRVLMPRFGVINERRHRLHEVVRLSGINIIVNDEDYPLILKVASLPGTKLQVYFLDNEDFFKRKSVFTDEEDNFFEDNPERMSFFCKGVLETVKKFGWPPDVIHCHGWMTSLLPLYLKTAYKKDPIFTNSKVIYSAYANSFKDNFGKDFAQKTGMNGIEEGDFEAFGKADNNGLLLGASTYADAVIKGDSKLPKKLTDYLKDVEKPVMEYQNGEDDFSAYNDFYATLLDN